MTLDDMTTILTGQFDVATATAQGWVQEAYRQAVAESGWLTESLSLATTTAGQADYVLPANVVSVREVYVAGTEYARVNGADLRRLRVATEALTLGTSGVFAETSSSAGADQLSLYPTPSATGQAIVAQVELVPADLVVGGGAGSAPVFSVDLHSVVLDGAIAIGYLRADERPDLAGVHDQKFQAGVARIRARKIRRVSGSGPRRVQIARYDFIP